MPAPLTAEQVEEWLTLMEIMEGALDGDGSTPYLPDVTPADAVRWIITTLYSKGYAIVKVKG